MRDQRKADQDARDLDLLPKIKTSVGLGIPVISTFEGGIQRVDTSAYSMQARAARPMMIGGLPTHPPSRGLAAPNVIPFSQRSRSMSATPDVDVKLRVFIPSPALDSPPTWLIAGDNRYFSGDGRGFQYSGGTSRAEIHAKVRPSSDANGMASIRTPTLDWGETKQYAPSDVRHVTGKPDWWHEPIGNPTPIATVTLARTDSNLNITARANNVSGAESGASYGNIRMLVKGGIPLMNATTPNINARLDLELRRGASGTLMAHMTGNHDGLPAYEV